MDTQLQKLEDRIRQLEANQIQVIMSNNADQNVFRSIQRTLQGNVNLGTGSFVMGVAPRANQAAMIEMISTTKGFLPPRMTTAQKNAIANPVVGLVVFDTTLSKLCVYTSAGPGWQTITSV